MDNFAIVCKVFEEGTVSGAPVIMFLGPDGNSASSVDEITLTDAVVGSQSIGGMNVSTYTVKLLFNPLKASHMGVYNCIAQIMNIGSANKTFTLAVESKLCEILFSVALILLSFHQTSHLMSQSRLSLTIHSTHLDQDLLSHVLQHLMPLNQWNTAGHQPALDSALWQVEHRRLWELKLFME